MTKYILRKGSEIGSLDAEADSFLSDCFIESSAYNTLLDFNTDSQNFSKRIILGRTGSGKTALLTQVSKNTNIKKSAIVEAESTVFEHIINNAFMSKLLDEKIDIRIFYKSLWLHVLIVKIIEIAYTDRNNFLEKIINFERKPYFKMMNEYVNELRDCFFDDEVIKEITNKISSGVSLEADIPAILNVDGKLSAEQTEKIQITTTRYVNTNLIKKQKALIKFLTEESGGKLKAIISIDDLDKSWLSTSSIRYDFINALLEAFKELLGVGFVKILISIRTDIVSGIYKNSLRQEEKDRSLIVPISWQKLEIRNILDKRINSLIKRQYESSTSVSFSDVFSFDINGTKADEYIISRTMLRPRDAIDFVNLCLSLCDGVTELNEDIVIEAEEKFYSSRKRALCDEWVSLHVDIETYINALYLLHKKSFKVSELDDIIKDKVLCYVMDNSTSNTDGHNEIATDFNKLVKLWFETGIIGIEKSESLIIYSSFDKPNLDITDLSKNFRVHPLFFREQ